MDKDQKTRSCFFCGKELIRRENEASSDYKKRTHCNEKCGHLSKTMVAKKELDKLPIKYCVVCEAELKKKATDIPIRYKKRICCSKKCTTIYAQQKHVKASTEKLESGKKTCGICVKEKPLNEFTPHNKKKTKITGKPYYGYCLSCSDDLLTEERLRKFFNITYDEYKTISDHQSNRCAICQRPTKRNLAVDHNHKTGLIRGLLCWHCNSGLGWFRDNPELLQKAADYLLHPPATIVLKKERFGCLGSIDSKINKRKEITIDLASYLRSKHETLSNTNQKELSVK